MVTLKPLTEHTPVVRLVSATVSPEDDVAGTENEVVEYGRESIDANVIV
jgi:hypothetical protein